MPTSNAAGGGPSPARRGDVDDSSDGPTTPAPRPPDVSSAALAGGTEPDPGDSSRHAPEEGRQAVDDGNDEGDDDQGEDGLEAALSEARRGSQSAFATLYRDVQPRLLRYATGLVGQDADDVTAEAWLQIARDLRGFTGGMDDFRGWTARIVRNRAIDQLRARARRPADPTDLLDLLDRPAVDDTAGSAYERFSTAAALALIAELPRDQAEAVLLRVVVGLDAAGAAAVLGKRPGAVRVAAHRGLKSLARRLEQRGGGALADPHADPPAG